jgi:type II secretory pathway component PulF
MLRRFVCLREISADESEMQMLSLSDPTTPRFSWWQTGLARLRPWFGDPIPAQTLAFCFDRFATMLNSGMPINEALRKAAPVDDAELAGICQAVEGPLRSGVPLSRALQPWKARLPEIVLPILEVGEVAGTLDGAAQRLAGAFGQAASLERRYRNSVCSPWLIILGLSLYHSVSHLQDSVAQMALDVCSTLAQLTFLYLGGRLALRFLWHWQALRYAFDTLKLALPHMGTVMRNLAAARWGRSFATLYNAGVPISTALEVSAASALNARYERAIRMAARQTRAGRSLAESLATTQLLPGQLLQIIATGEMTGDLGICLERFAAELESEAFTKATQEFVFIVSIGKLILTIVAVAGVMR